jgi:hypothetical protein
MSNGGLILMALGLQLELHVTQQEQQLMEQELKVTQQVQQLMEQELHTTHQEQQLMEQELQATQLLLASRMPLPWPSSIAVSFAAHSPVSRFSSAHALLMSGALGT